MSICPICMFEKCNCKKDSLNDSFCCPDEISRNVPDTLFASPFPIPKKIPTSRFSSPNSPLSPKELDELQRCIEEANDLLRSLGSERDENNTRQLQLRLLSLHGLPVKIEIDTLNGKKEKLEGRFATAGRDFLQINTHGSYVMILYSHVCSIKYDHDNHSTQHEQEFLNTDPDTRRELVFNFGEYVGKRRELVNLFFGLFLYKHLKSFTGKDVFVKAIDEQSIEGILTESREGRIEVVTQDGTNEVEISNISYVKAFDK